MKKLNLGCGLHAGGSWTNIDGSWNAWLGSHRILARLLECAGLLGAGWRSWPPGILHQDLRAPLPFPEETFDAVYASHLLEHLYRSETDAFLSQVRRVLRPGGILRLVTPDLAAIAKEYLRLSGTAPDSAASRMNELLACHPPLRLPPASAYALYQHFFDYHRHFRLFDEAGLRALLAQNGFSSIRRCTRDQSEIIALEEVEALDSLAPEAFAMALECRKA
jgi:SAM-dependent methyltransferase